MSELLLQNQPESNEESSKRMKSGFKNFMFWVLNCKFFFKKSGNFKEKREGVKSEYFSLKTESNRKFKQD